MTEGTGLPGPVLPRSSMPVTADHRASGHSLPWPILMQGMFKINQTNDKTHEQPDSEIPALDQKSVQRKSLSFDLLSQLQLKYGPRTENVVLVL